MKRHNFFMVSVFLVFSLALSGVLFAQRVIDLDKVWGDMRVLGAASADLFGFAVAYGDINGDGFMDIIIGAFRADPGGRNEAGEIYVILGNSSPKSTIDLNSSQADITIYGDDENDWFGLTSASGDINGDGFDDIIIGAPHASPDGRTDAGKTYVFFGSDFPSPPYTIDLSTDQADITVCGDNAYDDSGRGVASGDVNGDGIDDIIIGAYYAEPPGGDVPGATYVIFGKIFSTPLTIDLSTKSADLTVYGDDRGGWFGMAVASGDVNGDDYDDIIIGANLANPGGRPLAGETYVIFGDDFTPPVVLDLSIESADITIYGDDTEDGSGYPVACGDINCDGYDDIIIAASSADPGGRMQAGETYVIFGSSSPPSTLDLSTESADITICGAAAADNSGSAVASGDVNGDGYDDLIIGVLLADPGDPPRDNAGGTYVIFGDSFPSPPYTIDLSTDQADITIYGDDDEDRFGGAVASGDINGDGYSDMIIGAPKDFWIAGAGETYVIFGGGPLIASHGLGGKSWIKEFDIFASAVRSFKAFGAVNSQGEVHLAVGEIDGDGHDEIAAGQGEGGKSWVKFFEVDGSPISGFKAFGAANTNGELHMAIGNFDADPSDNEIAVAQGEGGQSWVKVFKADGTFIRAFKAFGGANAKGEVHLATGDLNKDGFDEIITGTGESSISMVKIFHYWGGLIRNFKAFDSIDNPGGELRLAVGNFDADPAVEIAAATGYNGGNLVRLFDKDGTSIGEFTAFGFGGNPNGDVQITAADIDSDGIDEVICGHGEGGSSQVKLFKADGTFIRSFKAFGGVNAQGEVHLGKSDY